MLLYLTYIIVDVVTSGALNLTLCSDGNQADIARTAAGLEISGSRQPPFTKTTVVLQSRTMLPSFARTPPPSTLVIGMPRFDQKLDELTAERKAARCAAEAMANLSVLPVAAASFPSTASSTVDSLPSVAVASTVEPAEHRSSPLIASSSSATTVSMEVEPCDAVDTSSAASHADKYSSYDRHFKKKFFGSERRPQSSEPIAKVADADQAAGDGGRDGSTPSPDVAGSSACKKARLAEPCRNTISPLCTDVETPPPPPPPPDSGALPLTTAVSTASLDTRPASNPPVTDEHESRRSPSCPLTTASASSAAAASLFVGATTSSATDGEPSSSSAQCTDFEPSVAVTQSVSDGSQPTACPSDE